MTIFHEINILAEFSKIDIVTMSPSGGPGQSTMRNLSHIPKSCSQKIATLNIFSLLIPTTHTLLQFVQLFSYKNS